MAMIRHDAPRPQFIPFAIEMLKRFLHHARNLRMLQRTTTHAGIQPCLDPLAAFNVFFLVRHICQINL